MYLSKFNCPVTLLVIVGMILQLIDVGRQTIVKKL